MTQCLTQTVGEWPEILVNTLYTEELVLLFSVHISYFCFCYKIAREKQFREEKVYYGLHVQRHIPP